MRNFLSRFFPEIVVLTLLGVAIFTLFYKNELRSPTVGYDCQLAEISPDTPLAYKQACREAKRIRQ